MVSLIKDATSAVDEFQESFATSRLEKDYERALRQTQSILQDEATRVLRVRLMVLEHENDSLQDLIMGADDRLEDLENAEADAKDGLIEAEDSLQRAQYDLRLKAREIETLKACKFAELLSLNTVSVDSTKLLTEKLALAREVATLRPEIEHLRSQAASHQSALSEKLALQRQLSSVQVELETEKRALKRTQAKDSRGGDEDARLESELEALKKDLAKERRDNQRVARDAQKQAAEWEGQKTIFESKLDAFRNKLRSTKEQLKEARAELHESQASFKPSQSPAGGEKAFAKPIKRAVARFDPDATIGTPGVSHAAKRGRQSSAVPGDKSTFSITPFLNRASNIGLSSPMEEEEGALKTHNDTAQTGALISEAPDAPQSPSVNKEKESRKTATARERPAALRDMTNSVANVRNNAVAPRKSSKPSVGSLEKVNEEEIAEDEAMQAVSTVTNNHPLLPATAEPGLEESESRLQPKQPPVATKRKRKLLGGDRSTLFDDDDAEAPAAKVVRRVFIGGGLRGGAGPGMSLARGGARKVGLKEFSPLKRDRRAAL